MVNWAVELLYGSGQQKAEAPNRCTKFEFAERLSDVAPQPGQDARYVFVYKLSKVLRLDTRVAITEGGDDQ